MLITCTAWIALEGDKTLTPAMEVDDLNVSTVSDFTTFIVQSQGGSDAEKASGARLDEWGFGTALADVTEGTPPASLQLVIFSN